MKVKITAIMIVILLGLLPFSTSSAQSDTDGSLDAALALFFASRSILLDEVDLEETSRVPKALMAVPLVELPAAGDALGHLIHATKQQRNNLQDSCRQLRTAYQTEGKTCELQILNDYCQTEEAKLNQRIGLLHKLRGDRRSWFTRAWHSVKGSGERIWSAVGPVGRRILRQVGPEAAEVVLSGGTLSGKVIRKLVIKEARDVGQAELSRLLERGVGRFLQSQAALAQSAGVADCTAESLEEARGKVTADTGESESQPQPDQVESCQQNWWSTAYWEENVLPELQAGDKRCGNFSHYLACLEERAHQGDCPEDAFSTCESAYQDIISTSSGQAVKIVDDQVYVRDDDNHFDISFSLSGGSVSGSVLIDFTTEYGDGDYCRVTQQKIFNGTFDPGTCTLTGTVVVTESHEENRNDICWGDPYERNENWSMIIQGGKLGPGGPYNQLIGETYPLQNYIR